MDFIIKYICKSIFKSKVNVIKKGTLNFQVSVNCAISEFSFLLLYLNTILQLLNHAYSYIVV